MLTIIAIQQENTPRLLRWIPKIGLVRWGFEGLVLNEFEGLEFDTADPRAGPVVETGADALKLFGLGTRTLGEVFRSQALLTGTFWVLGYLGLAMTRTRYLVMKQPKQDT